ncbi:MAG TPA: aminopeptidase [Saprospiraceae bacterium]|nr:aminopeptidase [Saprospiraceae bacterium]
MAATKTTSKTILQKYARLLSDYCLELKEGEKLYITSTTLAIPLIKEVYKEAVRLGVHVEVDLSFRDQTRILLENGAEEIIKAIPLLKSTAIKTFDAYLAIRAPYDIIEYQNEDQHKAFIRQSAFKALNDIYFQRTANGSLKRSLCQFPTKACANEAGMSLKEYTEFIYQACFLHSDDPAESWHTVRKRQEVLVNFLNQTEKIRYKNDKTDISFSVKGRKWINSDGRSNMPSGEVYTGPVENSVEGFVYFDYPSIYMGHEVQGISLEVKEGRIVNWDAVKGKNILDQVFTIEGSRYFGEVAIGTNYQIKKPTKNILFDEKIGGTIHMAIGQSYLQTGGLNHSSIHWDMIADMRQGGEIWADEQIIYKNGHFHNDLDTSMD